MSRLVQRRAELSPFDPCVIKYLAIPVECSNDHVSRTAIETMQEFLPECFGPLAIKVLERICKCPPSGEYFMENIKDAARCSSVHLALLQMLNQCLLHTQGEQFSAMMSKIEGSDGLVSRLTGILEDSFRFARAFNADQGLRTRLWAAGFMPDLRDIVLLKQETTAALTLVSFLFRVGSIDRAFGFSEELLDGYIEAMKQQAPANTSTPVVNIKPWSLVIQSLFGHLETLLPVHLTKMAPLYRKALAMIPTEDDDVRYAALGFIGKTSDYLFARIASADGQ